MRITRLCLVILIALTTTTLSATPKKKGGRLIPVPAADKQSCDYWYQCYGSDEITTCCTGPCQCKGDCIDVCGGPCDWDDSCPYLD
jgi:hypothetical protein